MRRHARDADVQELLQKIEQGLGYPVLCYIAPPELHYIVCAVTYDTNKKQFIFLRQEGAALSQGDIMHELFHLQLRAEGVPMFATSPSAPQADHMFWSMIFSSLEHVEINRRMEQSAKFDKEKEWGFYWEDFTSALEWLPVNQEVPGYLPYPYRLPALAMRAAEILLSPFPEAKMDYFLTHLHRIPALAQKAFGLQSFLLQRFVPLHQQQYASHLSDFYKELGAPTGTSYATVYSPWKNDS